MITKNSQFYYLALPVAEKATTVINSTAIVVKLTTKYLS